MNNYYDKFERDWTIEIRATLTQLKFVRTLVVQPTNAYEFTVYWTPYCPHAEVQMKAQTPVAEFTHTTSEVDLEIDLEYYFSLYPINCPINSYVLIRDYTISPTAPYKTFAVDSTVPYLTYDEATEILTLS